MPAATINGVYSTNNIFGKLCSHSSVLLFLHRKKRLPRNPVQLFVTCQGSTTSLEGVDTKCIIVQHHAAHTLGCTKPHQSGHGQDSGTLLEKKNTNLNIYTRKTCIALSVSCDWKYISNEQLMNEHCCVCFKLFSRQNNIKQEFPCFFLNSSPPFLYLVVYLHQYMAICATHVLHVFLHM